MSVVCVSVSVAWLWKEKCMVSCWRVCDDSAKMMDQHERVYTVNTADMQCSALI